MKFNSIMLISCGLLFLNIFAVTNSLKISLFYEGLCPDCRNFVTYQLYPTYLKLKDYIDLDLVPFGKAQASRRNGTWTFTCQHGINECYVNKVYACAINLFDITETMHFVACTESSSDPSSNSNLIQCAISAEISWPNLSKCITSGKGDTYLAQMGKRTEDLKPTLKFVPTILFDNKYDQQWQDEAIDNLFELVCKLLEEKPTECQDGGIPNIVVV